MSAHLIDRLRAELRRTALSHRVGRISRITGGRVTLTGIGDVAAVGDRVAFDAAQSGQGGEVTELGESEVHVLPEHGTAGLSARQPARLLGPLSVAPDDSWLGRIVDPTGRPLDGRPFLSGVTERSLAARAPAPSQRRGLGKRLDTGLSVFDTLLPIVRGQRLGLFAGSGVGKSTLLGRLARGLTADVVVVALIGERGRELREFTERILGPEGMARTVVVAASADDSPLLRRRCAETAMTVAEHFRDAGRHVLLLADSVTRYAEAHREIALAGGEHAALRGFPPSMAARIMALAERAGPGAMGQGDITAVFTVLVAGSDMDEPVADTLRGVLDGHVILDRSIAERGRFPPVDVARSVSRALPDAATRAENALISETRRILGVYERSELMVQSGLYAKGSDAEIDRALAVWPLLDRFFAASAEQGVSDSFARLAGILSGETGPASGSDQGKSESVPAAED